MWLSTHPKSTLRQAGIPESVEEHPFLDPETLAVL